MIVTHTRSAQGQCRVYLGGKSSLECWIEPKADGRSWSFHMESAVAGNALAPEDERAWAVHTLFELARLLGTPPGELASVPFECIAALHSVDPFAGRRVAVPRRRVIENGYMATVPGIARPDGDYASRGDNQRRYRS
jgi:hypothetical protein